MLTDTVYQNSETVSVVPLVVGGPVIYTNNIEVGRQVVAAGVKGPWIKPESASQAMLYVPISHPSPMASSSLTPNSCILDSGA